MLSRIRELFRRYASDRLYISQPGFALYDESGQQIGHLDRLELVSGRLALAGWTLAGRVGLVLEGSRVEAVPHFQRADVAATLQDGQSADVGFFLDQPFSLGLALFSVEMAGLRYIYTLPRFTNTKIRSARLRLLPGFLRSVAHASPAILRWGLTRDPALRAVIKTRLGLDLFSPPGSGPMNPALFGPASASAKPVAPLSAYPVPPDTPVSIILPVYNAFDLLPEVLDRVLRHTDLPWDLILVEDCSSDLRVRPFLRAWVAAHQAGMQQALVPGRITLLENPENRGFIRSVNTALEQALEIGAHVVLLNSDAFVPAGWASRLLRPILAQSDVASVTPMSNDAEIFSVPVICQRSPLLPGQADAIDAVAQRFQPDTALAVAPTGVGFCMAMSIAYLRRVGLLDTGFGRGYGEEVDWCQRARALGGRHLGLPGLFVEHRGGTSFGSAEKLKLVQTNNALIARRYPRYDREVQDFLRADPLSTPRLALAVGWLGAQAAGRGAAVPIYLAHSLGGGADKYLDARITADTRVADSAAQETDPATLPGGAVVLRVGGSQRWRIEVHSPVGVTVGTTDSFEFVQALLDPLLTRRIVYSCGVGDRDPVGLPAALLALRRHEADRIEILFHDFFPVSPSYCLLNRKGLYDGVPGPGSPDIAHTLRRPDGSRLPLQGWRAAWQPLLDTAERVVVFSNDSRAHVLEAYPGAANAIEVCPHRLLVTVPSVSSPPGGPPVIGVLGNIGQQKGAGVLADLSRRLETAKGAGQGRAEAALVVIGNIDPAFPLAASARVHGDYQIRDIPDLVARYGITCWLIPSIWPETFSYATHEALATSLPVYCFDLGAQAEAVRAAANGIVIPFAAAVTASGDVPETETLARLVQEMILKPNTGVLA